MHYDLCPAKDTPDGRFRFIGIYSKNREEWVVSDFGSTLTAITTVTLYDTQDKDSMEYILTQTKLKTLACSADKIPRLLELSNEDKIPDFSHIIYFDEAEQDVVDQARQAGITLVRYNDVLREGRELEA